MVRKGQVSLADFSFILSFCLIEKCEDSPGHTNIRARAQKILDCPDQVSLLWVLSKISILELIIGVYDYLALIRKIT